MYMYICLQEKENLLHYYMNQLSPSNQNLKLEIENMMFIRKDLQVTKRFKDIAMNTFNMSIYRLNFTDIPESVKTLNTLVNFYFYF